MALTETKINYKYSRLWLWTILIAIICVTSGILYTVSKNVNEHLRLNFLNQASLVANGLNLDRLKKLRGNKTDLKSLDYARVKSQLTDIRLSNNEIRFLYLLGQKPDGQVFFFSDAQKPGSKNYAPPGLIYKEISKEYLSAFKTGKATVTGEVEDRWGKVVTALVPIKDKKNKLIAMLGMDMKSIDFYSLVITRNLLPSGLTLLTIILFLILILYVRKTRNLKQLLGIDPLTALFNRKNILETADAEINRLTESGQSLSTIAIDIDNFKSINDCYGHRYGDIVLQEISSCLKNTIRKTDFVGRIGGEEFMVLLPDTDKNLAIDVAEKLRCAIESLEINCCSLNPIHISASFGVSENWKDNTDFSELLAQADQALYVSKNEGRNQVNAYRS